MHHATVVADLQIGMVILPVGHPADRVHKAERLVEVLELEALADRLAAFGGLPAGQGGQKLFDLRRVQRLFALARPAMLRSECIAVHGIFSGWEAISIHRAWVCVQFRLEWC